MLEWRQRNALNGAILYVVSTVFVTYMSFSHQRGDFHPITWNTLYWIILLFTAVNGVAKSFAQERDGRFFMYYTLASPQAIILSKIIYNAILLVFLALMGLGTYSLFLGNPVQDMLLFSINIVVGAIGFASSLTMVSGIANKTQNSSTTMAILGFPVILPMLLLLIRVSKGALDGLEWSFFTDELLTIFAINMIVVAVSYILFPYLWKS